MLPSFFLNTALFFGQKINKKCASENLSWTPCISEEQIYCQTQTDDPPPPYADSTQINCFIHRIDLALTLRFSVRRFISVVQQTSPLNRCNVRSILRQKLLIAYCFFLHLTELDIRNIWNKGDIKESHTDRAHLHLGFSILIPAIHFACCREHYLCAYTVVQV